MQHVLRSVLLGAGASVLAALADASPASAAEVRVTVAEYSSKTGPYFEEAAKAFEAANPGTDIRIEMVRWDVLQQNLSDLWGLELNTDIAGNANADLTVIATRWLVDFVRQGVVAPLDDYMTDAFKARFIPTFFEPGVLDGKTYGLPIASSARAMYYKELFEKAGITAPPRPGTSWSRTRGRSRRWVSRTPTASACRARRSRPTSISTMRCGASAATSSAPTARAASTASPRSRPRPSTSR